MQIYETEECVICLDDAKPPQRPFAPCGHQCCCTECGEAIMKSKMACPLCRVDIREFCSPVSDAQPKLVPKEEVKEFVKTRRGGYLLRLPGFSGRGGVTVKPGFLGKSKLARSVNNAMASELEQRQLETAGTDRMARAKGVEVVENDDDSTLVITYKLGRKAVKEVHPYKTWEETKAELIVGLDSTQLDSVLELATYHPDYYWLVYYHNRGAGLEDVLITAGLMGSTKRRRVCKS